MSDGRVKSARTVRKIALAVGLALVFVFATAVGFVLHLDTTAGRRLVARLTNSLVSGLLVADLRIERIDALTPTRLVVSRATLLDRLGKPLMVAEGLDARFDLYELLDGILGDTEVRVAVPDVRVERFFFALTRDPERGVFTVESAFDTVPSGPPNPSPKKVFVALPRIDVATATVTTDQKGIRETTARVTRLSAGLDVSPSGLVLALKSDDTRIARLFARDVTGRLASELRLPGTTRASLNALVGQAPVSAEVSWRGAELDLGLKSAELRPEALRELFGGWPLVVPARVSANAVGETSSMKARTEGELGSARFSGSGSLLLTPEVRSDLALKVQKLDLRSFDPAAPETSLDVDANVSIRLRDEVEIEIAATIGESEIAGYPTPATKVQGTYAKERFSGTLTVLDPKLATEASYEISGDGKIDFSTSSKGVDLSALAPYGVKAKGRATVRSRGTLEDGKIAATFDASLGAPDVGGVRAKNAVVRGRVEGSVSEPKKLSIDIEAEGEKLEAGDASLARFRATSKGSGASQAVTLEGSSDENAALQASAQVDLGKRSTLHDVRLESRRGKDSVTISAKRVDIDPAGVSVGELSLENGNGKAAGSIAASGGRRRVDLTLKDFDLARALAAFGLSTRGVAGRIDGHVRFDELGSERSGEAVLALRDGAYPPLTGVTAALEAKFDGTNIVADAELDIAGVAKGTLDANGSLARSIFDPRAPSELLGKATLAFSDVDLERAGTPWLEGTGVRLRGRATGKASAERSKPASIPRIAYRISTRELAILRDGASGGPPSEVRLDIDSVGELLNADGSHVALELVDARGPWVAATIDHQLGAEAIAAAGVQGLSRAILDAPIRATIKAHRRPLRMFGNAGAAALDGTIAGVVEVEGSAREPELDVSASLTSPDATSSKRDEHRLEAVLQYSAKQERYTLEARTAGEHDRLELSSAGRFGWLERGLGKDFSAKGEAALSRFGLARLGQLIGVPIDGEAGARCKFDVGADRIDAAGRVVLARVNVDRHPIGSGSGRFEISDGRAEAELDIKDKSSRLELVAETNVAWAEGGPGLDPRARGTLRATARDFDLAAIRPFVRDVVTRVSGKLNGRVELGWGAATSATAKQRPTTLRANATITDGTASLVAGGGLMQKIRVHAVAEGDGPLEVTFSGAARSREPNVEGKADVVLDGPRLKRLDGKFDFDSFPLLYDGVLLGRATSGAKSPLELSIIGADDGQTIDIHIPSVEVTLPKASDKSLIALEDDRSIEISDAPIDPEVARRAAKAAGKTTLKVRLGKQVRIKRGALDVPVSGAITLAPDGRLNGAITFPQGGVVPLLGQLFRIRRGSVTFKNQDVKEGTIALQASTRALDGTTIDLDVSGTVSEPVVAFQSDPPRSEDEIIALLLGVQADTASSTEGDENQQLAGAAMALAMNQLVQDSVLSGLQFGSGETSQGDTVSTVTMRVGQKVWVEGRTVKGSQYSVNPDERVSGVVDWRFAPSWSLRTQLGDISGVEIRWSLRY